MTMAQFCGRLPHIFCASLRWCYTAHPRGLGLSPGGKMCPGTETYAVAVGRIPTDAHAEDGELRPRLRDNLPPRGAAGRERPSREAMIRLAIRFLGGWPARRYQSPGPRCPPGGRAVRRLGLPCGWTTIVAQPYVGRIQVGVVLPEHVERVADVDGGTIEA